MVTEEDFKTLVATVKDQHAIIHGLQASVQGLQASVQGLQASVQGLQATVQAQLDAQLLESSIKREVRLYLDARYASSRRANAPSSSPSHGWHQ